MLNCPSVGGVPPLPKEKPFGGIAAVVDWPEVAVDVVVVRCRPVVAGVVVEPEEGVVVVPDCPEVEGVVVGLVAGTTPRIVAVTA